MIIYLLLVLSIVYSAYISFLYYKKVFNKVDYESLYHDSQQKLSWHVEALETKQMQYDKIESLVETLQSKNSNLNKELESLKKGMLDLPKLLGKNLGK
jgi:peptidoglycan hydrolase CwlO-like protein